MFISPLEAIQQGWITHPQCKTIDEWKHRKLVSPNAIDFTLDRVYEIGNNLARITETQKNMRRMESLPLLTSLPNPFWKLEGQKVYDGTSDVYVEVPEDVAAVLWTRSTFARNGVFIMSGLYDTGFKGNIGFTIYTIGGQIEIEPGTRIGQIGFIAAASAGLYAGEYNHKEGTHWNSSLVNKQGPTNLIIEQAPPTPQIDGQVDPLVGASAKSTLAQDLQTTSKWDSDQSSPPAGTKTFI